MHASPVALAEPELFESPDVAEAPASGSVLQSKLLAPQASNDIVSSEVRAQAAFAEFAGKSLDTKADAMSIKLLGVISSQQAERTLLPFRERAFESPLERFYRLKDEISQLERDLQAMARSAPAKKSASAGLARELAELGHDLSSLSTNPNFLPFAEQHVPDKETIQQRVQLNHLIAQLAAVPSASEAKEDSSTTLALFRTKNDTQRQQTNLTELDSRIVQLEHFIGNLGDDKTLGWPDLHSALQSVRRKLESLDQSKLDAAYRRIRTLISELDTLTTSKDKAQAAGQVPALLEKINQLFETVNRWDEAAEILPPVAARLQSLRDLREECAGAVVTVQKIEVQTAEAQWLLQQSKETLARVETSLVQNAQSLQDRVASVEKSFTALHAPVRKLK